MPARNSHRYQMIVLTALNLLASSGMCLGAGVGLIERLEKAEQKADNLNSLSGEENEEQSDQTVAAAPRQTVPFSSAHPIFYVKDHSPHIQQWPCSDCHGSSTLDAEKSQKQRDAHFSVKLQHAQPEMMQCQTCHQGAQKQLGNLSGKEISFDRSFEVCAQCHNDQFEDWKLGAHGKRLSGWQAPRIVETCTGCHNPHKPGLEKRLPAVDVRIPFRRIDSSSKVGG